MLSLLDLENLFQALTAQILNYSGDDANSKVRISWPDEGAPAFKRTDDVSFIQVNFNDSDVSKQKEIVYEPYDDNNANMKVQYIRVIKVDWVMYGPNAFDNIEALFAKILLPSFKSIYTAQNLSIVPDYDRPIGSREYYNGQWWKRTDLTILFNELVTVEDEVPYIQKADFTIQEADFNIKY